MAQVTIGALWRYPVKSMLGECLDALDVDPRGVVGDRGYAVVTADGKLGSGKTTRRFTKIDGLFGFSARIEAEWPIVRFPDGQEWRVDSDEIDTALSDALGQPVRVAPEGAVSHLDDGPLHLLSTSALAWLREQLPQASVDAQRFRPNLVLNVASEGPVEHHWIGRRLRIGEVELEVVAKTVRCAMTTFPQTDLPSAPRILKTLAQRTGLSFGVYANVIRPGRIEAGTPVQLL